MDLYFTFGHDHQLLSIDLYSCIWPWTIDYRPSTHLPEIFHLKHPCMLTWHVPRVYLRRFNI